MAKNCAKAVDFVSARLSDRQAVYDIASGEVYLDLGEIRRINAALTDIPMLGLPSDLVTPIMILSGTVRQFLSKVEMVLKFHRQMDSAEFADFFETLRQMNEGLLATCADIEAAVRVVEEGAATE